MRMLMNVPDSACDGLVTLDAKTLDLVGNGLGLLFCLLDRRHNFGEDAAKNVATFGVQRVGVGRNRSCGVEDELP